MWFNSGTSFRSTSSGFRVPIQQGSSAELTRHYLTDNGFNPVNRPTISSKRRFVTSGRVFNPTAQ